MKKNIAAVIITAALMTAAPLQVSAMSDEEYGMMVQEHFGGRNEYNGEKAKTREDAEMLELQLQSDGYIWLSSRSDDVTDAEMQLYTKYLDSIWGDDPFAFTENENIIYYVYKPAFDTLLKEFQEDGSPTENAEFAMAETSVVIDYDFYYNQERVGTHSTEWGDGIPDDAKNYGYLHTLSPLSVTVTFEEFNTHVFYDVEIPKGEASIKMLYGCYSVREINGTPIEEKEEVLPYTNNIVIREGHKEDNYELELAEAEAKYKIVGNDGDTFIMETPDSTYEPATEEIVAQKEDKRPVSKGAIIAMFVSGIVLILGSAYILLKKKKRRR